MGVFEIFSLVPDGSGKEAYRLDKKYRQRRKVNLEMLNGLTNLQIFFFLSDETLSHASAY